MGGTRTEGPPDDVAATAYSGGGFRTAHGDERTADGVIFPDHLDGIVDEWTGVALAMVDKIAALTGNGTADDLIDLDSRDAVAEALRLRRRIGGNS